MGSGCKGQSAKDSSWAARYEGASIGSESGGCSQVFRRICSMNKIAIAFLTRDRVDLSKRTIAPLLQPDKFDLFWIDGSDEARGQGFVESFRGKVYRVYGNVKGGADTAVVYALT